jgi:16S rRNA (cytidine1402-2'-O)-methyltransferase
MRVTVGEAIAYYKENDPRGEYVLVVEGATLTTDSSALSDISIEEQVLIYMKGGMSKMDAVKKTAKERGIPKNDVYKLFNND